MLGIIDFMNLVHNTFRLFLVTVELQPTHSELAVLTIKK